jgi:hypothetical protein
MLRKNYILLLIALVTVGCLPVNNVSAASRRGLDVVIIIDHSGSMYGVTTHPVANDRDNKRIDGARYIINRLAEDADVNHVTHRISVINFGSGIETIISNRTIRPGTGKHVKNIANRKVTVRRRSMGNTNTPAAMKAAKSEFSKITASNPSLSHDRKMVLITDGRPFINKSTSLPSIRKQIRKIATQLKADVVGVYVMGIDDASNYWLGGDGNFWEEIAGSDKRAVFVKPTDRISENLHPILDNWFGSKTEFMYPKNADTYICPPYLRRLVFNLSFSNPAGLITITDPEGRQIYTSAGKSISSATSVRIPLDDPFPGFYKINKTNPLTCSLSIEKYSADIKRISPGAQARTGSQVRLVFQAYDSNSNPAKFYPAYPLKNLSIVVKNSSGVIVDRLPAVMQAGTDGKFEAEWTPTTAGIYNITLKGDVDLGSGITQPIFQDNQRSYDTKLEVIKVDLFYLNIDKPDLSGKVRVFPWTSKLELDLNLLNDKKEQLSASAAANLISQPENWLQLELIDEYGNKVPNSETKTCIYDPDSGIFSSEIPVSFDWLHGEGWAYPAKVQFRLVPEQGKIKSGFYLNSLHLPPETESLRVGGDDLMSVGPIQLAYSLFLYIGVILIFLLLLAFLLFFLFAIYIPNQFIRKEDAAKGIKPVIKIYDPVKDIGGHNASAYPVSGKKSFKYDNKVKVEVDGTEYIAEKFRVKRIPTNIAKASVEIRYRLKGAKTEETVILKAGGHKILKGLPELSGLSINLEA